LSQPPKIRVLLVKQLDELTRNPAPENSTQLDSNLQIYRLNYKKYRILYQIQAHKLLVLVVAVGFARDIRRFYKKVMDIIKRRRSGHSHNF